MPHSAPHHRFRHAPKRATSRQRGYDYRWEKYRHSFLHADPICRRCGGAAECVDHVIPHRGDPELFWDRENHQSLCLRCHNKKTATEDRLH